MTTPGEKWMGRALIIFCILVAVAAAIGTWVASARHWNG